jgi:hypothetical protein
MTGPVTCPVPADIPGTVRGALSELAKVSEALDAGVAPTVTMAVALSAAAVGLRDVAALMTGAPVDDGTASVRGMLAVIASVLDIPRPAAAEDERAFARTRSRRADEVVRACRAVLESADDATARNWRWAASWLRTAASDHEVSGYDHDGPGAGLIA